MSESPETFDIEAWLTDAHLPEESADVYKGGHLVAELNAVKRRIGAAETVEDAERTAGDKSELSKMWDEYERLLQAYADSKLTVYVRALTSDRIREMRAKHEEKYADTDDPAGANAIFGYELMSAAIVGVRSNDGERADVSFTADQVKAFEASIGQPQFKLVMAARQTAQNAVPEVDADFLQRRSGTNEGSPE